MAEMIWKLIRSPNILAQTSSVIHLPYSRAKKPANYINGITNTYFIVKTLSIIDTPPFPGPPLIARVVITPSHHFAAAGVMFSES